MSVAGVLALAGALGWLMFGAWKEAQRTLLELRGSEGVYLAGTASDAGITVIPLAGARVVADAGVPQSDQPQAPPERPLKGLADLESRQQRLKDWLRTNAESADKTVDTFCSESSRFKPISDPSERGGPRDAATYLAVRVDWEDGRVGILHLPEATLTRIRRLPTGDWLKLTPDTWEGLDFTWMHDLLAYDVWTLSASGPLNDAQTLSFYDAPIPNYVSLQHWAKLRLAKGLHEPSLDAAALEVRQLATLCASSGTLIGVLIGRVLLRYESEAWASTGQPLVEPVTAADNERYKRVALSSAYYLAPGVSKATRERALACSPLRCATLMESLGLWVSLRELVPEATQGIAWLESEKPCDLALVERFKRAPPPDDPLRAIDDLTSRQGTALMLPPDAGP